MRLFLFNNRMAEKFLAFSDWCERSLHTRCRVSLNSFFSSSAPLIANNKDPISWRAWMHVVRLSASIMFTALSSPPAGHFCVALTNAKWLTISFTSSEVLLLPRTVFFVSCILFCRWELNKLDLKES
jgi:hypothetical protein